MGIQIIHGILKKKKKIGSSAFKFSCTIHGLWEGPCIKVIPPPQLAYAADKKKIVIFYVILSKVTNPSTGEVITNVPDMGKADVDKAINAAHQVR